MKNISKEIIRSCQLQEFTGFVQEKLAHAQLSLKTAEEVIDILSDIVKDYKKWTLYEKENEIYNSTMVLIPIDATNSMQRILYD